MDTALNNATSNILLQALVYTFCPRCPWMSQVSTLMALPAYWPFRAAEILPSRFVAGQSLVLGTEMIARWGKYLQGDAHLSSELAGI